MEALETVLRKIEDLKKDLYAEIVIQKEEGHREPYWSRPTGSYHRDGDPGEPDTERWVVDKPKIANPDKQKREAARTELQKIYDSSEWYSARYAAGKGLGLNTNQLSSQVERWVVALDRQRYLTIVTQEERSHFESHDVTEIVCDGYSTGSRYETRVESECIIDQPKIEKPDIETRKNADSDLTALLKMLNYSTKRELYEHPDPYVRKIAATALGYSNLRVWAHEHPVTATVTGIAAVGLASGLVYALVEHLSR